MFPTHLGSIFGNDLTELVKTEGSTVPTHDEPTKSSNNTEYEDDDYDNADYDNGSHSAAKSVTMDMCVLCVALTSGLLYILLT